MKKILNFFLQNITNDKSSIEYRKAKTLEIFLLISITLLIAMFFKSLYDKNINDIILGLALVTLLVVSLFILKKGKVLLAGNTISLLFLLMEIIAMFLYPNKTVIPYFFYVFFVLILFSAMFASRKFFIASYILILGSTVTLFIINKEFIPKGLEEVRQFSFIVYENTIFFIFIFSLLFTRFINIAIKDLFKKTTEIESQNRQMKAIAEKIQESASDLTNASGQLLGISQDMSQNANEQATTTEEVSSSMEEMLATIINNTENAEDTNKKTSQSAERLKKGSQIILQTIDLVNQISKETAIISDIAFQTNILSLNASIIAAKAGDSGDDFNVVATEIRALAEKSKKASNEIEKLSKSGKNMTQIASKVLEKSLSEITNNADLMQNISAASKEQNTSANTINNSIQQLSKITNENSASAEEMSASAEQLSAQAEMLREIATSFNQ